MSIAWKKGSRFKSDPQKAFEEIESIRLRNGGDADAETIVREARNPALEIHQDYEWDDSKAAHQHRLSTARLMLRCFIEPPPPSANTARPQRVYEVVTIEEGNQPKKVYRSVKDIMADPDSRAELLGRAMRELISFRNRFRDLQELAVVLRAVDELLTEARV